MSLYINDLWNESKAESSTLVTYKVPSLDSFQYANKGKTMQRLY